jgi:hypothetical protein
MTVMAFHGYYDLILIKDNGRKSAAAYDMNLRLEKGQKKDNEWTKIGQL